ncbi:hypothetical protein ACFPRL_18030 [Pseudoclavibacter helvolus]
MRVEVTPRPGRRRHRVGAGDTSLSLLETELPHHEVVPGHVGLGVGESEIVLVVRGGVCRLEDPLHPDPERLLNAHRPALDAFDIREQ